MGGARPAGDETGQASVEWAGLVLIAVLALGTLGLLAWTRAGRAPASDRGLGELVAQRLVCGPRGSCAGRIGVRAAGSPALPGAPPAVPKASPAVPTAPPAVPKASPAVPTAPPGDARPSRARAIDALRRLRAVGATLVKRAWIVCIGYRRFRYELEHPRAPNEAMPLDEAIDIANGCLNPYAFLVEDG
jgi:hypothetical protein